MIYEITLFQKIPSKKNAYLPQAIKKNGKVFATLIKNSALQAEIDSISCQVPADMRGLMLEHPDLRVQMTVPDGRSDQDNMYTTLLDILKSSGVIRNDSIAQFNGRKILEPCIISDHWKTVVTLTTRD